MIHHPIITPRRTIWTWSASALAGAVGLGLAYGFHAPVVADMYLRAALAASLGLFMLSRLLMLVPPAALGARLRRWWVDYVLIVAAAVWWAVDHSKEPVILRVGAVYSIAVGGGAVARAAVGGLVAGWARGPLLSAGRRLFLGAAILAVTGGTVLSLPRCWQGPYPVEPSNPLALSHLARHWLDCVFTATAALTGTALAVRDLGYEFSRLGQLVILVLMQIGGLAILVIGSAVGWRLRQVIGWGSAADDTSPAGMRRLIRFVCLATLLIEGAGAAALYHTWDPKIDANFHAAQQHSELLAGALHKVPFIGRECDEARLFASVFHAVSAFCNVGLTLPRDSLIAYRDHPGIYAAILPLMVIGSLGGPVLYDLCRRLVRRDREGRTLSKESKVTLGATVLLIGIGAAFLLGIERTVRWQLRYPREEMRRLTTIPARSGSVTPIVFTSEGSQHLDAQRIRSMTWNQQWKACVFQSIAARGGGMRTVRLDESSLSPASRTVLMAWMLIGGGLGGSAGGLRIVIPVLLASSMLPRRRLPLTAGPVAVDPRGDFLSFSGESAEAADAGTLARTARRHQALAIAAALTVAMFALVALTTFVLVYREPGSLEADSFEAVSACCNVGLSTGLTQQLSVQGRIALILAMLLGRVLPPGILLRCTGASSMTPGETDVPQPAVRTE